MVKRGASLLLLFPMPFLIASLPSFLLLRWVYLLVLILAPLLLQKDSPLFVALFWALELPLFIPLTEGVSAVAVISFFLAAFCFSTFPLLLFFYERHQREELLAMALKSLILEEKTALELLQELQPQAKLRFTKLCKAFAVHPFSYSGSLLALPYKSGAIVLQSPTPLTEETQLLLRKLVAQAESEERARLYTKLKKTARHNLRELFAHFPDAYFLYTASGQLLAPLVPKRFQVTLTEPTLFSVEKIVLELGYALRWHELEADPKEPEQDALSFFSHEMKTALTSLLLLLDREDPDPALVAREWQRLAGLLGQDPFFTKTSAVALLTKEEMEKWLKQTLGDNLRLRWEGSLSFFIPQAPFFAVLDNLCQNARYHSPKEAPVAITFHCSENLLRVQVENHNPEQKASLHTSLSHGLGLHIVERLVKELQGEFAAEQKGTLFSASVTLPLKDSGASRH